MEGEATRGTDQSCTCASPASAGAEGGSAPPAPPPPHRVPVSGPGGSPAGKQGAGGRERATVGTPPVPTFGHKRFSDTCKTLQPLKGIELKIQALVMRVMSGRGFRTTELSDGTPAVPVPRRSHDPCTAGSWSHSRGDAPVSGFFLDTSAGALRRSRLRWLRSLLRLPPDCGQVGANGCFLSLAVNPGWWLSGQFYCLKS